MHKRHGHLHETPFDITTLDGGTREGRRLGAGSFSTGTAVSLCFPQCLSEHRMHAAAYYHHQRNSIPKTSMLCIPRCVGAVLTELFTVESQNNT